MSTREARTAATASSRALVAVRAQPAHQRATFARLRPSAPFIAQLLANRMALPQTRLRRRAAPEEVSARYSIGDALDRQPIAGTRRTRRV